MGDRKKESQNDADILVRDNILRTEPRNGNEKISVILWFKLQKWIEVVDLHAAAVLKCIEVYVLMMIKLCIKYEQMSFSSVAVCSEN